MHITHTDFTHRQWDYYERHCVQCTIRWHSQVSVIKFCCGNTGSFNSGSAHFSPFQNSISRSCFPPWVFVLHDETYTASSCLTQLYVEFFCPFLGQKLTASGPFESTTNFCSISTKFLSGFGNIFCDLVRKFSNFAGKLRLLTDVLCANWSVQCQIRGELQEVKHG